jgi:hypothetical protein
MASTIIARFNVGRKVRCHNEAVERGKIKSPPKRSLASHPPGGLADGDLLSVEVR